VTFCQLSLLDHHGTKFGAMRVHQISICQVTVVLSYYKFEGSVCAPTSSLGFHVKNK